MEVTLNVSQDRYRALWVATCTRFPEFIAEARTVDELREKFPDALELANLPRDAKLIVRFYYEHATAGAATLFALSVAEAGEQGDSATADELAT